MTPVEVAPVEAVATVTAPTVAAVEAEGLMLIDAKNGFNELGRKAMFWTVWHRWAAGARFAFNCYRHEIRLLLRQPGGTGLTLHSREGVTQGDPLAMALYGIALLPLAERLREESPSVMQPWYAGDAAMMGVPAEVTKAMILLTKLGPMFRYFPEPEKLYVICIKTDEADTRVAF